MLHFATKNPATGVLGCSSSRFFFAFQNVSLSIRTIVSRMVLPFVFSIAARVWMMLICMCTHLVPSGAAPRLSCTARPILATTCFASPKAAFLEDTVFTAEIAEHVDVVNECGKPLQQTQVGAAEVPCQVVDLADVGHEVAVMRVLEKEMGGQRFFALKPHAFEGFSHCHVSGCSGFFLCPS